jgi:serine/threonine-protein kinase
MEEAGARVGTVLKGKWTLDRLIGVGGTAAVYEARHRNGSRVAVKVLNARMARSASQLARFHREGTAANRVGHPGVSIVYDDDVDDDGAPFLVMDLLEGQTVAERAAENGGVLEPLEVVKLADRLLDVLIAAHEHDVIHRDIKPQNLFLSTTGELKVLDFGIARITDTADSVTSTEVGTVLGTPAFLPPEQARGRHDEVDARSDLWAVGATMYTLITGRFVHDSLTRDEQLGLAMTAAAPSIATVDPTLPKALVALIDRALAFSREERWQDARSMQSAVRWVHEHWSDLPESDLELPDVFPPPMKSRASWTPNIVTLDATGTYEEPPRKRPPPVALALVAGLAGSLLVMYRATTDTPRPASTGTPAAAAPPLASSRADPRPLVAPWASPTPGQSAAPQGAASAAPGSHTLAHRRAARPLASSRPAAVPPPPPEAAAPAAAEPTSHRKAVSNPFDRRY